MGFAFQREGQIDYSLVIYTLNRQVFLTTPLEIPRIQGAWRLARVLLNTGHPHPSRITGATMNTAGAILKKTIQPLTWFVVLGAILALASRVALGLV